MNINDPTISRTLAVLIQPVVFEDRRRFIEDAEKAPDLDSFILGLGKYETDL
jgi:hypothetical protein